MCLTFFQTVPGLYLDFLPSNQASRLLGHFFLFLQVNSALWMSTGTWCRVFSAFGTSACFFLLAAKTIAQEVVVLSSANRRRQSPTFIDLLCNQRELRWRLDWLAKNSGIILRHPLSHEQPGFGYQEIS